MKQLRTLLIKFENELASWEVSAFRGAIIEKVGRENLLFNHHLDDNKYYFRYPVLQYKSIRRQPAILCLGEGVKEIHKLFTKPTWEIKLKDKEIDLVIDSLELKNVSLKVSDKSSSFGLKNWLALNEKNHKKYMAISDEISRIEMLEKILIGNILSFAKGMNWDITEQINVRIQQIGKTKNLKYKNTHLLAFTLYFSTNVELPQYIGLGKGASHGYGMVNPLKQKT